jgi:hypothetical protein
LRPSGPYIFQNPKSKNFGSSVEELFVNPGRKRKDLLFMKSKMERKTDREKNSLDRHVQWIFEKGEARQPKALCPHCKTEKVKYFSVRYTRLGYSGKKSDIGCSFGVPYTACNDCLDKIRGEGEIFPFKFSVIDNLPTVYGQKEAIKLFLWAFDLKRPLTRDKLFSFFEE